MKPRINPYLKKIASLVGEESPSRGIRVFVGRHRNANESLELLAQRLGVNEIIEENLPFEGGLFQMGDGRLVIKLNVHSPLSRKRFTLAHEIAHLLLGTIPARRSTNKSDPELERACDSIAAELLMPAEDAISLVRSFGVPSPQNLRAIASKFEVSLHAAAIRIHDDFKLWRCAIGMWQLRPKVGTVWFVGPRRWDAPEPDAYSFDLALASNESVRSNELWQRGASTDPVQLELLHLGNDRVLGLVAFVEWSAH